MKEDEIECRHCDDGEPRKRSVQEIRESNIVIGSLIFIFCALILGVIVGAIFAALFLN